MCNVRLLEDIENIHKMAKFMNPKLGNLNQEWVNDVLVPCVVKHYNMNQSDILSILRKCSPEDYDDMFLELAVLNVKVKISSAMLASLELPQLDLSSLK